MKVFRVASGASGNGPYGGRGCFGMFASDIVEERKRHPGPEVDGLGYVSPYHRFGFSSKEQLCAWWDTADLSVLHGSCRDPMLVLELEVPDEYVKRGRHQVMFLEQHASRVNSTPLDMFILKEREEWQKLSEYEKMFNHQIAPPTRSSSRRRGSKSARSSTTPGS